MSNVTTFPQKAGSSRGRSMPKSYFFAELPKNAAAAWTLAQIEDHGDKVVVRVTPLRSDPPSAPKRKYVVDTILEGFRLAYRVHGFHDVQIEQVGPSEYRVYNPPALSGSGTASA